MNNVFRIKHFNSVLYNFFAPPRLRAHFRSGTKMVVETGRLMKLIVDEKTDPFHYRMYIRTVFDSAKR